MEIQVSYKDLILSSCQKMSFILMLLLGIALPSQAQVYMATPDNFKVLIPMLKPGDVLQLEAGTYKSSLDIRDISGGIDNPIVITGPESGQPAIFLGNACCNTVQLGQNSDITIRYLTLDGQDINYIDAVNSDSYTNDIIIEYLRIVRHGGKNGPDSASQNTVGISTKGIAFDWTIRYNTIIESGTGIYLGNSTGNSAFIRGLIEYNLIVDTLGYNMQIKQQNPRPEGIGLPVGNNKTVIRHNVFSKSKNASVSGGWARPNLLVGHWPLSGTGKNDLYEIYGNFFYQNYSEVLFQGEGNVAFYNNVMFNDLGDAIAIMAHKDVPKNISIFNNTIVASSTGIRFSNADPSTYLQLIAANAVFADVPISAPTSLQTNNRFDQYGNAGNYLVNPIAANGLDLFPISGMLSGPGIDTSSFVTFTDWKKDFNGNQRTEGFYGAYANEGSNPGWLPNRELKPVVNSSVPTPNPGPLPEPTPDPTPNPNPTPEPVPNPGPIPDPIVNPPEIGSGQQPTPDPQPTPPDNIATVNNPSSDGGGSIGPELFLYFALLLLCRRPGTISPRLLR